MNQFLISYIHPTKNDIAYMASLLTGQIKSSNLIDDDNKKEVISQSFIDTINPDFFDALIVAQYKKIAQNNKIPTDDRYQISENNHEFQVYKMFTLHFKDKTPKENEELRNNSILEEIRSYTNSDYQKLFASCNHIEKTLKNENQWRFNSGLDYVFQTLPYMQGNPAVFLYTSFSAPKYIF